MKLNNLVVIKRKLSQDEISACRRFDAGCKPDESDIKHLTGIIQDIIISERHGKTYIIDGSSVNEKDIIGFKVLVE